MCLESVPIYSEFELLIRDSLSLLSLYRTALERFWEDGPNPNAQWSQWELELDSERGRHFATVKAVVKSMSHIRDT